MNTPNVDPHEIAKFTALSRDWWDTEGPLHTLHDLNPTRLAFVQQHSQLAGARVLDVGCGGGILSESLAKAGAQVTAIDMEAATIDIAKQHAAEAGLTIDYRVQTLEDLARETPPPFDIITCMEMLEHVPNPSHILQHSAELLVPGGTLFVSTLNRHPKAYALAIVGAEYLLGLLPKGTHDYQKFIKPSELTQWARQAGLYSVDLQGLRYEPFSRRCSLTDDVRVNYLAAFCAKDHAE